MATSIKYFIAMVFLMFLTVKVSNAVKLTKSRVCLGSNAPLEFDEKILLNQTIILKWFFKPEANDTYLIIVDFHGGELKLQNKYRNRITSDNDVLRLKNVTEEDNGSYKRESTHNKDGNPDKDFLELTVMVPPNGPPTFNHTIAQDKSEILECLEPSFTGSPESTVVMTDSNNKKQHPARVTLKDDHYRCCLQGDALKCMNPNIDHCLVFPTIGDISVQNGNEWMVAFFICLAFILVVCIIIALAVYICRYLKQRKKAKTGDAEENDLREKENLPIDRQASLKENEIN